MKLLRLHVENFGVLRDYSVAFTDGWNVFFQKNGWGKSTLAVFIKAMLYGLPATGKRSLDDNERKKYAPWQGGAYGGSLEFSVGDDAYRVERFFGAKESEDTFELFDLTTNLPSCRYSETLGTELFGIDAAGFERSTYISQRQIAQSAQKEASGGISAKLSGADDTDAESVTYETAIAELDKCRKKYEMTGERGLVHDLERQAMESARELEELARAELAFGEQEKLLEASRVKLEAIRADQKEKNAQVQKAAAFRERAAFLERKEQMQTELNGLCAKKEQALAFFGGELPTGEEVSGAKALLEEVRSARASLDAIPASPIEPEERQRLEETFSDGVISEEKIQTLRTQSGRLRELRAANEALKGSLRRQEPGFPGGLPGKDELDAASHALDRAEALQKRREAEPEVRKSHAGLLFALIFALACGAILFAVSFFGVEASLLPVLRGVGGGFLGLGIVLTAVFLILRSAGRKREEEARAKDERIEAEIRKLVSTVQKTLSRYGAAPGADPRRALTELAVRAESARSAGAEALRVREELRKQEEKIASLQSAVRAELSRYGLAPAGDGSEELDVLRHARDRYLTLQAEENRRVRARKTASDRLESAISALLPFLKRYDPESRMKADECMETIVNKRNDAIRYDAEIRQKTETLRRFVAEKGLDSGEKTAQDCDFDRLNADLEQLDAEYQRENEHLRILQNNADTLAARIEEIPEKETACERLQVQLNESRANLGIIKKTREFLDEARTALTTRYLAGTQQSFDRYLSMMVGKAPEAVMKPDFAVALREGGKTREMESFSRGWRDTVEFCTRLAIADALCPEGEKPFLLLDDPFVNLDDERFAAAEAVLRTLAGERQILYFHCRKDAAPQV